MSDQESSQGEEPMFTLRAVTVSVKDLGAPHLRLEVAAGIHVLYGLNGVGKSRILDALQRGHFTLHAPLAAGGYWNPLWAVQEGWSFGHENELDWPFKSEFDFGTSPGFWNARIPEVVNERPKTLLSLLDDLEEFSKACRYFVDGAANLPFHWVARIAYWIAKADWLDPAGVRLVGEAIVELIEQGDVVVHPVASPTTSERFSTWSVTHYATITPDSPRLYAWQQWAAGSIKAGAYDNFSKGKDWQRSVDDYWGEMQARLIPDAALAGIPTPEGAEPFEPQGPRFEVFNRVINFGKHRGRWEGFSPIAFLTDDHGQLDEESMAFLRRVIDTSEDFASTQPPSEYDSNPSRETALDEFMFGSTTSPRLHPAVYRYAGELGDRASSEFKLLLSTATPLRARIVDPGEWAAYGRMRWESMDRRGAWVPLTDLSDTQRRLATLSIRIAMHAPSDAVSILLIDEPERGLHRIAERHLVAGLDDLTRRYPDLVVIVASHSPSFLRPDVAVLHHIERDANGVVQVNRMPAISGRDLDKLGMSASDLLQLTRIVILVEGQHDEWVLRHTFGDEFDRMGVKVMSMRGANRLISAADGTLLFDYTEAHMIVMLDRTRQDRVDRIWNEALASWNEDQRLDLILKILERLLPTKRSPDQLDGEIEGAALKDFCAAVITRGRQDRISFLGLSKDDIQDYYSPSFFTTRGDAPATFAEARREWRHLRDRGEKTGNFKEWMRKTHDMRFNERNFTRAVKKSDLHPDFQSLFKLVSDLSDLLP